MSTSIFGFTKFHRGQVHDQLQHVVQLEASGYAFAALLPDASVVTWGNRYYGGSRKEAELGGYHLPR